VGLLILSHTCSETLLETRTSSLLPISALILTPLTQRFGPGVRLTQEEFELLVFLVRHHKVLIAPHTRVSTLRGVSKFVRSTSCACSANYGKGFRPSKDAHTTSGPSPGWCANANLTTGTELIDANLVFTEGTRPISFASSHEPVTMRCALTPISDAAQCRVVGITNESAGDN
jgi:hypothetical protein